MKVISTNIGNSTTFLWNGEEQQTGIFKYPVNEPLQLAKTAVLNDTIVNKKVHGGVNKACYLFSAEQYPYWKELYPDVDWNLGMFGENLTVEGLDEATTRIGDTYQLGTALVQVSQPREPCYKLGVRFSNQRILKQFIEHGYPGTYVRILKEGIVRTGDTFILEKRSENPLTVKQFYHLLYDKEKDPHIVALALSNMALPAYKRERLKKFKS